MSYRTKRQLRADIEQLLDRLRDYEAERDEATTSARNAIRVLKLTPYIHERAHPFQEGTYFEYDVNQFLEDIDAAAKRLDENEEAEKTNEAFARLIVKGSKK